MDATRRNSKLSHNLSETSFYSISKHKDRRRHSEKYSDNESEHSERHSRIITLNRDSVSSNHKNLLTIHKEREMKLIKQFNEKKEEEIQKMINKNMIEIRKNCFEHDIYLDHFCFDCGVGVCKFCLTLPKHESHLAVEKKTFNIQSQKARSKIFGSLAQELRRALKVQKDSRLNTDANTTMSSFGGKASSTLNEDLYIEYKSIIEGKFNMLNIELQELKQKKLRELKGIFESNQSIINTFESNINAAKKKWDDFIKFNKDLIPQDFNNDIIFLQNYDIYSTGIKCFNESSQILNYIKNFRNNFSKEIDTVYYSVKENLHKHLNEKGSIINLTPEFSPFYTRLNDKLDKNQAFIDTFLRSFCNKIKISTHKQTSFASKVSELQQSKSQLSINNQGANSKQIIEINPNETGFTHKSSEAELLKDASQLKGDLKTKNSFNERLFKNKNKSQFTIVHESAHEHEYSTKNVKSFAGVDGNRKELFPIDGNSSIIRVEEEIALDEANVNRKKEKNSSQINKKAFTTLTSPRNEKRLGTTKTKIDTPLSAGNPLIMTDMPSLINFHKKNYYSRAFQDQSYRYNYFFSYISSYVNFINGEEIKINLLVEDGKNHILSKNMNNCLFPQTKFSSRESSIAGTFFTLLMKYNCKKLTEEDFIKTNKQISTKPLENVDNQQKPIETTINKKNGEQEGLDLFKPIEGTSKIQLYDSESKITFRMDLEPVLQKKVDFPYKIFPEGLRSIMIGMSIYIFGGKDINKEYNSVVKYDIDTQEINEIGKMYYARSYFSTIYDIQRNNIYLIGGENNKSCERFSLADKKCYLMPFMNTSRCNPTLYIHQDSILYAFGGYKYGLHKPEKNGSIERLNLRIVTEEKTTHSSTCLWEKVNIQNEGCIDLRYDYISVMPFTDDCAFILGGVMNRKTERSVSILEFKNHRLSLLDGQILNYIMDKLLSDPMVHQIFEEVLKK